MGSDSKDVRVQPAIARTFVLVREPDDGAVVDRFEAPDWGPAILIYAERIRSGAFPGRVSLREVRLAAEGPGAGTARGTTGG